MRQTQSWAAGRDRAETPASASDKPSPVPPASLEGAFAGPRHQQLHLLSELFLYLGWDGINDKRIPYEF